jgi:DNA-directed RNA polymerase sigma subunit (sigma70/sigma32)
MPQVLEAHRAYKQADADALAMRARARARLGLAVETEYDNGRGSTLEDIARNLGVVAEQVRRYRQAYRDWLRDHPGEQLS